MDDAIPADIIFICARCFGLQQQRHATASAHSISTQPADAWRPLLERPEPNGKIEQQLGLSHRRVPRRVRQAGNFRQVQKRYLAEGEQHGLEQSIQLVDDLRHGHIHRSLHCGVEWLPEVSEHPTPLRLTRCNGTGMQV
jgi:hypothetical protein